MIIKSRTEFTIILNTIFVYKIILMLKIGEMWNFWFGGLNSNKFSYPVQKLKMPYILWLNYWAIFSVTVAKQLYHP